MTEFNEYLTSKKIDWKSFKEHDESRYTEFSDLFSQVHPNSFTAQKLFLINEIRRTYPLKSERADEKPKAKQHIKPKIVPRIKK